MISKTVTSLALVAACLTAIATMPAARADDMASGPRQLVTNGPQADPGDDSGPLSARQNVRESHEYDALVRSNAAFRAARMRKECGPINDAALHASCIASFNVDEGSSVAPLSHRHHTTSDQGQ